MAAFRRRGVALLVTIGLAIVSLSCFESGEVRVQNSTDRTLVLAAHTGDCTPIALTENRQWQLVGPGESRELFVFSGTRLGDACVTVLDLNNPADIGASIRVEPGRLYEVRSGSDRFTISDVGEHD